MATPSTHGVLFVHSSPAALCPHLEWAISAVLGHPIHLSWDSQPVLPTTVRSEFVWKGPVGSGATLATALRGWEHLRFEVTENASAGVDGSRYLHTPDLGVFSSAMDVAGNTVISEDRVRSALELGAGDAAAIAKELRLALGGAWDDELEPFRHCSEDTRVVWFHQVG